MRAKIQKWGNSLAVRIPKALAELVELSDPALIEDVLAKLTTLTEF